MSPALNESSAIRRFERSDANEIRDEIIFDFCTGLPRTKIPVINCGLIIRSSVSGLHQSSERLQGLLIKEHVGVVKPNFNAHI